MKQQIKQYWLWMLLLILTTSSTYVDAPPSVGNPVLTKQALRKQKRIKRRKARKLRRQQRKIRQINRFLNSRVGRWMLRKAHKKAAQRANKIAKKHPNKSTIAIELELLFNLFLFGLMIWGIVLLFRLGAWWSILLGVVLGFFIGFALLWMLVDFFRNR